MCQVKVSSGQFQNSVVKVRVLHFGGTAAGAGAHAAAADLPPPASGSKRKLAELDELHEPSWP